MTPARITFRAPASPAELPELPSADVSIEAGRVTVESRRLQADLSRLLRWADDHAIELAGLAARPASLEDVFLDVITNGDRATATPEEVAQR